jgi:hypothetical protein
MSEGRASFAEGFPKLGKVAPQSTDFWISVNVQPEIAL